MNNLLGSIHIQKDTLVQTAPPDLQVLATAPTKFTFEVVRFVVAGCFLFLRLLQEERITFPVLTTKRCKIGFKQFQVTLENNKKLNFIRITENITCA